MSGNFANGAPEVTLTPADLENVDLEVEFGDYDGMQALSKDIQNGRVTDEVVKIDGYVSNFAKGMAFNIAERSLDGTELVGTTFVIEGVEEEDYPADETHVILTGKVVDDSGILFTIHTLPEFIEVVPDAE